MSYFLLAADGGGYEYIKPGGIAFNLSVFLIATLLGGLLATILVVLHQAVVGRFFRALNARRAYDRASSKSLADLGMPRGFGLRRALRAPTSAVRKLVTAVLPDGTVVPPIHSLDDDLAEKEAAASAIHAEDAPILHAEEGEKEAEVAKKTAPAPIACEEAEPGEPGRSIDPDTATFYLDDLHRRRAELRFFRRGNEAILLIPTVLVFVALAATLPIYLPRMVELLDTAIAAMLGGGA